MKNNNHSSKPSALGLSSSYNFSLSSGISSYHHVKRVSVLSSSRIPNHLEEE